MSSPTLSAPRTRGWARRLVVAGLTLGVVGAASLAAPSTTATADSSTTPRSGKFTVSGAGFGHGWGMSQYGAYGAAKQGLSWQRILAFYYPKTKRLDAAQHRHHPGLGHRGLRRRPDVQTGVRRQGQRRVEELSAAHRVSVRLLADQPLRLGLQAGLQVLRRQLEDPEHRSGHRHLEGHQQRRRAAPGAAERILPWLPRRAVAGQAGQQRAHGEHGVGGALRTRRRALGDADLLALERGPGPGGRSPHLRRLPA